MVENISSKVKTFERRLPSCKNTSKSSIQLPASPDNKPIRVVFTFGSDEASIEIVDKFEPVLENSPSLSSSATENTTSDNPPANKLFSYVKRTGSSLRHSQLRAESSAIT